MLMIQNPIIPGFAGDPSIVRAGEDYYVATSSFEWFPGVPIYHSKDLKNWKLEDYGLKTKKLLDLTGVKPSAGVWAPCLSYCEEEGLFYLLYSIVHSKNNWYFDVDNYLVTSPDIHGPWSDPVYICSNGFDYSLFHDTDGRKWIVGKDRDFRTEKIDKRPIILQEYDPKEKKMIGKPIPICTGGTQRRFVEGPHLYKRNGWYFLMVAEGGTGYGHCVVMLRSRNIAGPYECYEGNPIITSQPEPFNASENGTSFIMYDKYNPDSVLQKSGHGSLVETTGGEWYVTHLCARPLLPELHCTLGRETSIQKMRWTRDDRLVMDDGTNLAKSVVPGPDLPVHPWACEPVRRDFNEKDMPLEFQSVRNELTEDWVSLSRREGFLSLKGRESLTSNFYPSLIARKLTAFRVQAGTCLEYQPESYHHRAGLTVFYDLSDHYTLFKTLDEESGEEVLMVGGQKDRQMLDLEACVKVPAGRPVWLRASIDHKTLQFFCSLDGETYEKIGPELSMLNLSDEGGRYGRFTGTYIGMFAQDTISKSKWAYFDWFEYEAVREEALLE